MFGRTRTEQVKDNASAAAEFAAALARDKKFRKQLIEGVGHGYRAKQRVSVRFGIIGALARIAADEELRAEAQQMVRNLQNAWNRLDKRRSHRTRNTLLLLAGAGGAAAAVAKLPKKRLTSETTPRTVEADIEVNVPVSTAYNQWTQFEEFPQFMDGVEQVRQLDDQRLHWVAEFGGTRHEWDAEITEQLPDERVAWRNTDGKDNAGVVTFHKLDDTRSKVMVQMDWVPEGIKEKIGDALGAPDRRVAGDLERFKAMIESRGQETGGWRGEVPRDA
jgi:uncharacterized membrane protein